AGAERVFRQIYADAAFDGVGSPGVLLNLRSGERGVGKVDEAMSFYHEVIDNPRNDVREYREAALDHLRSARLHQKELVAHAAPTKADMELYDDEFSVGRKLIAKKDYAGAERIFRQIYGDAAFDGVGSPGVLLNL